MYVDFKITTWERVHIPKGKELKVLKLLANGEVSNSTYLTEKIEDAYAEPHMIDVDTEMTIEENFGNSTIEVWEEINGVHNVIYANGSCIWNDPNPIEGNDYKIISIEPISTEIAHISYNGGKSEAEVPFNEIEWEAPRMVIMTIEELANAVAWGSITAYAVTDPTVVLRREKIETLRKSFIETLSEKSDEQLKNIYYDYFKTLDNLIKNKT